MSSGAGAGVPAARACENAQVPLDPARDLAANSLVWTGSLSNVKSQLTPILYVLHTVFL